MKRKIITILKIVFTVILVLNTFIWLIAQGSGHRIPVKTNLIFGTTSFIFLILVILTIYLGRKNKN